MSHQNNESSRTPVFSPVVTDQYSENVIAAMNAFMADLRQKQAAALLASTVNVISGTTTTDSTSFIVPTTQSQSVIALPISSSTVDRTLVATTQHSYLPFNASLLNSDALRPSLESSREERNSTIMQPGPSQSLTQSSPFVAQGSSSGPNFRSVTSTTHSLPSTSSFSISNRTCEMVETSGPSNADTTMDYGKRKQKMEKDRRDQKKELIGVLKGIIINNNYAKNSKLEQNDVLKLSIDFIKEKLNENYELHAKFSRRDVAQQQKTSTQMYNVTDVIAAAERTGLTREQQSTLIAHMERQLRSKHEQKANRRLGPLESINSQDDSDTTVDPSANDSGIVMESASDTSGNSFVMRSSTNKHTQRPTWRPYEH